MQGSCTIISSINALVTFTSQVFSSCSLASFCICLPFLAFLWHIWNENKHSHLNRNNYLTHPLNIYLADGLEMVRVWGTPPSEVPIQIAWNLFPWAGWHLRSWFHVQSQGILGTTLPLSNLRSSTALAITLFSWQEGTRRAELFSFSWWRHPVLFIVYNYLCTKLIGHRENWSRKKYWIDYQGN